MAAPSVTNWTAANATATTVTINAPGGVAISSGKLILWIVSTDTASTVPSHSAGAGMGSPNALINSQVADNGSGASTVFSVFARIAGGSEPTSYTVNVSVSRFTWFQVIVLTPDSGSYSSVQDALDNALSGGALVNNTDYKFSTSATEPSLPTPTTLGIDRRIVWAVTWDEGKSYSSGAPGSNLYATAVSTNAQRADSATQAVAGATATANYDISSGTRWIGVTLMVKNPSGSSTGDLAAAGVGSTSIVGGSLAAASLSAAGAGSTNLAGTALKPAVLSSAAIGATSFTGSALFKGALASAGLGTATFVGGSYAAAALAATGAGAATWTGAALGSGVLQASGTSAAALAATPADQGALGAAGVGVATFAGASLAMATWTASGVATAAFGGSARGWVRQAPDGASWAPQEPDEQVWTRQTPSANAWTVN